MRTASSAARHATAHSQTSLRRAPRRLSTFATLLAIASLLVAAACGSGGQAADSASGGPTHGSSASAGSGDSSSTPPEDPQLTLSYFPSGAGIPTMVAKAAGYFDKYGLNVKIVHLPSATATQALAAGKVDMYLGGAAAMNAHLSGLPIIYAGALVDHSLEQLVVKPSVKSFKDLAHGTIATTGVGAFGEILIRRTAAKYGLHVGNGGIKLAYNKDNDAAVAELVSGHVDGAIVTSPSYHTAIDHGFKLLIDYGKQDTRLTGPGIAVTSSYAKKDPNTIKDFMKGYLKGLKRALDDPEYAKKTFAQVTSTTDDKLINYAYNDNKPLWNKNLTVNNGAIDLVLKYSSNPKAKTATPDEFYTNKLVRQVNEHFANKLFANAIPSS